MSVNPGTIVVATGFAILGGLAAWQYSQRDSIGTKPASCAPYNFNEVVVGAAIRAEIAQGESDPIELAAIVDDQLFGDHPDGGQAVFPPTASPKRGVKCVWDKTVALAERIIAEEGGIEVDPWIIVEDNSSPEPTTGKLFHATSANFPSGTQGSLLGEKGVIGRALVQAGVPNTGSNRLELLKLTECSPWNHALVNYDNSRPTSNFPGYGPNASGIMLNSQHYNNFKRMMEGKAPKRSKPSGGFRPTFWIPNIKRNAPVVVLSSNADGTPGINPPQEILDFGFEDVPPGQYGCDPYRTTVTNM